MLQRILGLFALMLVASSAQAADWPTYRADAARSGYTSEQLPERLSQHWQYRSLHPPAPAWPRDDRMFFDLAAEVVVANGHLVFGSSADGRVTALHAPTGETTWTFFTGAPIRFAPAIHKQRVYVVSDDGYLYCLNLVDGQLIKRWRPGPSDAMILGNGRMVSRWAARGGPVVLDGVVYFAAGIWQSDGVYLQAIDAETHATLWTNDTAGKIYMAQPHGGANAESGISPQGYLIATAEKLLVPTGRAVPAVFNRADGKFGYYHLQANGRIGGSQALAAGDYFYNGGSAFKLATGETAEKLIAGNYASTPGGIVCSTTTGLRGYSVKVTTAPDRKGTPIKTVKHEIAWTLGDVDARSALIVAGDTIVCGGDKKVTLVDAREQKVLATHEVDGAAYGLAVAGNALYVSTTAGSIYRLDGGERASPIVHQLKPVVSVATNYAAAAAEIVERTGLKEGFCVDVACTDGSLALALAQHTNLQIYVLCRTASDVAAVRKMLTEAGMYGARVTVHQGSLDDLPYGKYFADLVISSRSLENGPLRVDADSPPRVLRPYGGMTCTGPLGKMQVFRRGELAKSGNWTHQYSDLGNSCYSNDELVQGELHALWFRDVDLEMPQRHGRGPAPVYHQGRMFVEGIDALRAVDAYNGRSLWQFSLPNVLTSYSADHLSGTAVTGSNLCVAGDSVYVHDKKFCYRLDAATGRKLGEFPPPANADGTPGRWGYVACDGQLLFGSLADEKHQIRFNWRRAEMTDMLSESKTFFALDGTTGELRWRYDAQESIRHNAVAIGDGTIYLIDRKAASDDKLDPKNSDAKLPTVAKVTQAEGKLVALESTTGRILWKKPSAFGTMLVYSPAYDALLMGYQSTRFKLPSEVGGRLAVFRGESGEKLWDKAATYSTRPFINEYTVYAQGGAWDLLTGEPRAFELKRSYGCGQISASKHLMLFRSATLGYQSMDAGAKLENYGGIRPGCWINALPVGGLVLLPDASAGCSCSYQNRSWMALEGKE